MADSPSFGSSVPSRDWLYRSHKDGRSPAGIYVLALVFGSNAGSGVLLVLEELSILLTAFSAWQLGRTLTFLGVMLLFLEATRGVLGHRPIGFACGISVCLLLAAHGINWATTGDSHSWLALISAGAIAAYLVLRRRLFFPPEDDRDPAAV